MHRSVETELRWRNSRLSSRLVQLEGERLVRHESDSKKKRRGALTLKALVAAASTLLSLGALSLGHRISGGCPKGKPSPSVLTMPVELIGGEPDAGAAAPVQTYGGGSGLIHGG